MRLVLKFSAGEEAAAEAVETVEAGRTGLLTSYSIYKAMISHNNVILPFLRNKNKFTVFELGGWRVGVVGY